MKLPPIIVDSRVPTDEVYFFVRGPIEVVTPWGRKVLREPDAKIVNLSLEKSDHDWVTAPH